MTGLRLISAAHSVPQKITTNADFERTLDTSDEWIATRTGIRERRFANGVPNSFFASSAAREALCKAGLTAEDIGVCIAATFTPDTAMPNLACTVAQSLNLGGETVCFDLNAACSGFVYALSSASALLAGMKGKYALVIGSEVLSKYLDMTDRSTCVLFGDGAGAAIFAPDTETELCFYAGCRPNAEALSCGINGTIQMEGQAVFRFAAEIVPDCVNAVLKKARISEEEIQHIVCHQANKRIIEAAARRLNYPIDKFFMNLQSYGNTSAASIPIALSELAPKKGSKIICVGFGAGLSYGAALITV